MKSIKMVLLLLVVLLVSGCTEQGNEDSSFDPYVTVNGLDTVFVLGDEIPDFMEYFKIFGEDDVKAYEVITPFDGEVFSDVGDFLVTMVLTLDDDSTVSETITLTVEGYDSLNTATLDIEILKDVFRPIEVAYYYAYDSTNYISFNSSLAGSGDVTIHSEYREYFNPGNMDNMFHLIQDIDSNISIIGSDQETMYMETYMTFTEDGVFMFAREGVLEDFELVEMDYEEVQEFDFGFREKYIYDLTDGLEEFSYTTDEDGYKYVTIPLSTDNFSPSVLFEMSDAMNIFGLLEQGGDDIAFVVEDYYDLIECVIVLNSDLTEIMSIQFTYDEFLMTLFEEVIGSLSMIDIGAFEISNAIIQMRDFSVEEFEYVIPDVEEEEPNTV